MADLYCKHCGEPWDVFSVTDAAADLRVSPKQAHELFRRFGCGFFDEVWDYSHDRPAKYRMRVCKQEPIRDDASLAAYGELADLLGDDVDGTAAMAEDFGLF
jgi:hypothetical protein